MRDIESLITPFIEEQFPEFYLQEGPRFVDFVKQYYAWLEQQNQELQVSRDLLNTRDIDKTSDDFVKYFKNKYLKGVPVNTKTDDRLLVKHARDLHSLRGTAAGVALTLKAVYGQDAEVYYPGQDIFRSSDGTWVIPRYLELSPTERVKNYGGKQVIGLTTGATAFVESVLRRRVNGRFVDVIYLSSIEGDFSTGELVVPTDDRLTSGAPKVIGSLTQLSIVTGGAEWRIGDRFEVTGGSGRFAKARVTQLENQSGKVIFELQDGGWGYDVDTAEVIVSNRVLTVSQKTRATIDFQLATNSGSGIANGAVVERYYSNGDLEANGSIISVTFDDGSTTQGTMIVAVDSNTLITNLVSDSRKLFIAGNSSSMSVTTAEFVEYERFEQVEQSLANIAFSTASTPELFEVGSYVYRYYANNDQSGKAVVVATDYTNNTDGYIVVSSVEGDILTGESLVFTASNTEQALITSATDRTATGNVTGSNTTHFGVHDVAQPFIATDLVPVIGTKTLAEAYINTTSTGFGANFRVGTISWPEDVLLSPDFLSSYNTGDVQFHEINLTGNNSNLAYTDIGADGMPLSINGGESVYIDSAAVSNTTGFIPVDPHPFANDDAVLYFVAPGNTAVTGLTTNTVYYVLEANSTGFKLASEVGNTTPITLTATATTEDGHGFYSGDVAYGGYGFVKFEGSNLDSILFDCFRFNNITIGEIASITSIDNGDGYNTDPFVTVLQRDVAGYGHRDYIMRIDNAVGAFVGGELIEQTAGELALIVSVDNFSGTAANGSSTTAIAAGEYVWQSNATTNVVASGIVYEVGMVDGAGTIKLVNVEGDFSNTVDSSTKLHTLSTGGDADITDTVATTKITVARALVKSTPRPTSSKLYLRRINLENTFIPFGDGGGDILGRTSGATASVVAVGEDADTEPSGLNAEIPGDARTANGVATALEVYDSGYGYFDSENVTLTPLSANSPYVITARTNLVKQGLSEGYFSTKQGFLSSTPKLHDNYFYQDYSYEVVTSIPYEEYIDVLKKIAHVAGTIAFGRVNISTKASLTMSAKSSVELYDADNAMTYNTAYTRQYTGGAYSGSYATAYNTAYTGAYNSSFVDIFNNTYSTAYTTAYTRLYATAYTRTYTNIYTRAYGRNYTSAYTKTYIGTYGGSYSRNYVGVYANTYSHATTTSYSGAYTTQADINTFYTRAYTLNYAGSYTRTFTRTVTINYNAYFGGRLRTYTGVTSGSYTRTFVGATYNTSYTRAYGSAQYTGVTALTFNTNYTRAYAASYSGTFTGVVGTYTGSFVRTYGGTVTGTYSRSFVLSYSRGYVGTSYTRSFVTSYGGRPVTYTRAYAGAFYGGYATGYNSSYAASGFAGSFAASYTRAYGALGNYTRQFVATSYSTNYTRGYTTGVVGTFTTTPQTLAYTGSYASTFGAGYTASYVGNYSRSYGGAYNTFRDVTYTSNYTHTYSQTYVGNFNNAYTAQYSQDYNNSYTKAFTGFFIAYFGSPYTGNYTQAYSSAYAGTYTSTFSKNYIGTYSGVSLYTGAYTDGTSYTNTFVPYTRVYGSYSRLYTLEQYYSGAYVSDQGYTGTYTDLTTGYSSTYAQTYTGAYSTTPEYTGRYTSGSGDMFTGAYVGAGELSYTNSWSGAEYTATYAASYVGRYNTTYTREDTYTLSYTSLTEAGYVASYTPGDNYTSVYTGSEYTRQYTTAYTRAYSTAYTREATFTGVALNYTVAYTGTAGTYTASYTPSFTGDVSYTAAFTSDYNSSYSNVYTLTYTKAYNDSGLSYTHDTYSGTYSPGFTKAYTGNYSGNYSMNYSINYTATYTRLYVA